MARGGVPLPFPPAAPTRPRVTPNPRACRHLLGRKPAQNSDLQPDLGQHASDLLSRQAGNLGQLLGEAVLNWQHSRLLLPIRPSYLRDLLGSQRPAQNRLNFWDDILVKVAVLLANSRQHGSDLSFRNASRLRNLLHETILSGYYSFPRRSLPRFAAFVRRSGVRPAAPPAFESGQNRPHLVFGAVLPALDFAPQRCQ